MKLVLFVKSVFSHKIDSDLNTFCLSIIVKTSAFLVIKFKKLLAIDIDVHLMKLSSEASNHLNHLSSHAE
ncbi:MAG: hypothetical protein Q8M44_05720 [bacterium]|nr:hypothetical protein [bacterium]